MNLRRPLLMTISGRYLSIAIQLVGSLIVARLLTPIDFGLFGIAASVVAVIAGLREFGVTTYLIQLREMDRAALGRGVAFTVALSAALGLPLFLARNVIAGYFGDPRVAGVLAILCVSFVLVPLTIGATAILYRQMRLGVVQALNVLGVAVGTATSVGLAALGHGPNSLAIGQVMQLAVVLAGLLAVDARSVLVWPVFTGLWPMVRFGLFSSLGYIVNQLGSYGTPIILGRMIGARAVGLYERGNGLVLSVSNDLVGSIVQVVYVGLTQMRDDPTRLSALLLRSLANLTGTLFSAFALLSVLAEPVVLVLFGPQWLPSVPLLRLLALGGLLSVGYALYGRLLLAFGETALVFRVDLAGQAVRLLLVMGLARFGLEAAACGSVVGTGILLVIYLQAVQPFVRVRRRDVLMVYAQSTMIAALTALGPALLVAFHPMAMPPILELGLGAALGGVVWLVVIMAVRHSMAGEVAVLSGQMRDRVGKALRR